MNNISIRRFVLAFVLCLSLACPALLSSCIDVSISLSSTANTANVANTTKQDSQQKTYTFRNKSTLNEHFNKHGKEMGFKSAAEYEAAASNVVNNPNALHKLEKEDNDDVYYVKETNDFVIVSTDGFLRTYFRPDNGIRYFNKQ